MVDEIGAAAGVVWSVLDREGQLTLSALKHRSGLSDQMLSMAVGWLAREGKLTFLREGRVTRVSRSDSWMGSGVRELTLAVRPACGYHGKALVVRIGPDS